jgi:ABC-type transport system involved in multi-copper enzyme maturation permease subunit
MSLRDVYPRHLALIAFYAARHAMRGGAGILFLVLTLTCGLLIAHVMLQPVEAGKKAAEERYGHALSDREVLEELAGHARPVVAWMLSSGESREQKSRGEGGAEPGAADVWAAYLLDDRPAFLSAVLLLLMFSLPFLITFGSFNLFSGDIGSRGVRYHLLRTERSNIFFGRFLGGALFTVATTVFLLVVIVVYVGWRLDAYSGSGLALWGLRGLLALALVSLPYVALCSWISASIDSPFLSLVAATMVIGAVPLFTFIGRATWEPLQYLIYALPWGLQNYLLHHEVSVVLGAGTACLGYTALFLFLGYRRFARRDL